jgi:hypothetical protein
MTTPATLFPSGQNRLRVAEHRIRSVVDVEKLSSRIDKIITPEVRLKGAGIIFVDADYNIVLLRKFSPYCRKAPIYVVLKEPEKPKSELAYAAELRVRERESKLLLEASATVLSCSAAALSWVVVVGSGAAAPISGGGSVAITYLSLGAATATTAQCLNGGFRTWAEANAPEHLDSLDSEEWYRYTAHALDVISLTGAAISIYSVIRATQVLKASTGKSYRDVLAGLNRQERKRLTEEVIRARHPGVSNNALRAMVRNSSYPKRYATIEINKALTSNIKGAISASTSFVGSSVSGVVRNLAVGLYEVID